MQKSLHSTLAAWLGTMVLISGASVLCSWFFDSNPLFPTSPNWVVMKANAALAFLLAGIALVVRAYPQTNPIKPGGYLAQTCAILVVGIGFLSLLEYLTGINFHIDQLLAAEKAGAVATSNTGRMAPSTAVCFILSGASFIASWFRFHFWAHALALGSGLVGLLVVVGYIYGAELFAHYTRMAFHTALLFLILSAGTLCLNRESGPLALFRSPTSGGIMIRRLLPAILLIPLIIGWFRLQAELAGWFGPREGVALFAFSNLVLVGSLIWVTARQLDVLDLTRKKAEDKLVQFNSELELRVVERTSELETANKALLQNRSELNGLFESLPGLYLVLASDFQIIAASDAYLKATMTSREKILGHNLFEIFPDNPEESGATGVTNLKASLNRVLQTKAADTMAIQKYDVRRADGIFEERYWSPINSPVFDAGHEIKYIVHRVEEVTEFVKQKARSSREQPSDMDAHLVKMEAEVFQSSQKVQATNRQLEAANRELESFSYSVSHDLRAPLRAITGFTHILNSNYRQNLDQTGQDYLARVLAAAVRMSELIDDLLTLSKINRSDFNPQTFNISSIAQSICDALQQEDPSREVGFSIDDKVMVTGDPRLLRIALENLIGNAWKFTSKKDRALIAFGSMSHPENGSCCYVRDNGAGFEMSYAHKLFGAFQRLHPSSEFPGTGIGLAIVQRIINRHGGRIWAESGPDQGAAFYFTVSDHEIMPPPATELHSGKDKNLTALSS